MAKIMALLAKEWVIGVSVCIFVVLVGYLIFSILLIRRCRKHNYDVGASAFVPVINLIVWFKSRKYKKALALDLNIADDEEFSL